MATRLDGETLRWLDALGREGSLAELGDGQLLERFLAQPGASSEAAFEVLVRRHGPQVLSLCRRVRRDDHDAADAFQATFLVLARRASTIRDRDHLAPWLGRVARRIARRSRDEAARRAARERRIIAEASRAAPAAVDGVALETAALVGDEVDRLPEADRLLLRLTYWQGKTYEEAAAALSWPIGTVRSRLSRVRERLRGRLARLGLAPALAAAASSAVGEASAAQPPEAWILQTVRAAVRSAGGMTAAIEAGVVPATVAALVNGELSTMAMIPWKSIAVLFLLGGSVTAGVGALALRGPDPEPGEPARPAAAPEPAAPLTPQAKADSKPKADSKAKADSKSILTNGGVEDGEGNEPKGWTTGAVPEGATVPGVEYTWSRTGHEGKASLCLKKTVRRYYPIAQWSQKVKHEGGGPRLKVSAWVKADRVTKAILDAQFLDDAGEWSHAWAAYIGPKEANGKPFTHGWKKYEGVVAIPPGTKQILIAPQIYGPGTVWFDDIAAEYTDAPATDPTGS
jgi:RNA polymerase sigma factor (sigma-70 family)